MDAGQIRPKALVILPVMFERMQFDALQQKAEGSYIRRVLVAGMNRVEIDFSSPRAGRPRP